MNPIGDNWPSKNRARVFHAFWSTATVAATDPERIGLGHDCIEGTNQQRFQRSAGPGHYLPAPHIKVAA